MARPPYRIRKGAPKVYHPLYDPLAPIGPKRLRTQARYAVGASINPLAKAINDEFNRREKQGSAAIGDFTQKLQQQLAPLAGQIGGYYRQAETRQQDVTNQLANRLGSVGGQEAAALQAKLAQAGLPTDQAQQAGAVGAGAANTSAALGSANLASLIAAGAAQQSYAGKLPGIAALGGLQTARQNLAQLESQRGTQLADLRAKIPGLVQSELSNRQNLEFQKAAAKLGFAGSQERAAATVAAATTRAATTRRGQDITAKTARTTAAAGARQPNASLSKTYGYIVDSRGHPVLDAKGKKIPVSKTTGAGTNPAAKAAQKRTSGFFTVRGKTFTEAQRLYKGTTQKKAKTGLTPGGTTTVRTPYHVAYQRLWNKYGTQLQNQYNYSRPAVNQMIVRALANAGYKRPPSAAAKKKAAAKGAAAVAPIGNIFG